MFLRTKTNFSFGWRPAISQLGTKYSQPLRKFTSIDKHGSGPDSNPNVCCNKKPPEMPKRQPFIKFPFWMDKKVWAKSATNTFRCLIGCSTGDLSTMFFLQSYYPQLPLVVSMGLPMVVGVLTSLSLETLALKWKEQLTWKQSFETASMMSLISMLTMEFTENIVSLYLTQGQMNFHEPFFWMTLIPSLIAGFLAPLPYNYYKLKKYGASCH
mmetsp:Transcript_23639/g.33082  ORF Transcript_23639/g.33082 Transcript_23639/m.33082 type:complete len:212 (+) Transcript_23639:614-1249(+)